MSDDLVKEARLALWSAYCDKKMELEAANDRIEKLEAALREMLSKCTWQKREQWCGSMGCHCQIARKVLEGKDD